MSQDPDSYSKPPLKYRLLRAWRRLSNLFGNQTIFAALLLLIALIVASAFAHYFFERGHNPEVRSILSGFQWVIVMVISSSSPWEIVTDPGKVLQYGVLLIKPGLIAVITAAIASRLLQFFLRKDQGMGESNLKDHIVICGWSGKGAEIISEIRGIPNGQFQPIAILAPLPASPTKDEMTTFISGDPTLAEDLKRVGIQDAKTAIILADNSYPDIDIEAMDSRTLLATLAIETLNPKCYTCVEVIHSENRQHFERTTANELVVTARLTGALLAHSAVTHGLSRVVGDLVTRPEGDQFYWVTAPTEYVGKPFASILQPLKEQKNIVPIAVATGQEEYDINPPSDRVLKDGDRLLVIAKTDPGRL